MFKQIECVCLHGRDLVHKEQQDVDDIEYVLVLHSRLGVLANVRTVDEFFHDLRHVVVLHDAHDILGMLLHAVIGLHTLLGVLLLGYVFLHAVHAVGPTLLHAFHPAMIQKR